MSFLKNQLKTNDSPITQEYLRLIKKEIIEEERTWDWAKKGYKLYPSSFTTWNFCPQEFIRSRVKWSGISEMDGKHYTDAGKAIHWMLQRRLAQTPKVQRIMCFPHVETAQELHDKLKAEEIEVPVRDLPSGLSGRGDLPPFEVRPGEWAVVDFKSTSKPKDKWNDLKTIPLNYKIQLCLYAHIWNRDKYFPVTISLMEIMYYNLMIHVTDDSRFKEIIEPYTQELDDKAGDVLKHCAIERARFLNNEVGTCGYPLCPEHHAKVST